MRDEVGSEVWCMRNAVHIGSGGGEGFGRDEL